MCEFDELRKSPREKGPGNTCLIMSTRDVLHIDAKDLLDITEQPFITLSPVVFHSIDFLFNSQVLIIYIFYGFFSVVATIRYISS